ncbi:MAG: hypothetical protein ACHQ0J_04380 [Candidatus Dormibacterales bacterium]
MPVMPPWFGDLVFAIVSTLVGLVLVLNLGGIVTKGPRTARFWRAVGVVWLALGLLALIAAVIAAVRK